MNDDRGAVIDCLRLLHVRYAADSDLYAYPRNAAEFRVFLDQVINANVMTYLKTWLSSKSKGNNKHGVVSMLTNKLAQFECITIISRKWQWNKVVIQSLLDTCDAVQVISAVSIQKNQETSWIEVNSNLSSRQSSFHEYDVTDAAFDCLRLLEQKYGKDTIQWPARSKKFYDFLDRVPVPSEFRTWVDRVLKEKTKQSIYSTITNKLSKTMSCLRIEHGKWIWNESKVQHQLLKKETNQNQKDKPTIRVHSQQENLSTNHLTVQSSNNGNNFSMNVKLIETIAQLKEIQKHPLFASQLSNETGPEDVKRKDNDRASCQRKHTFQFRFEAEINRRIC
jgi:hypothetical protein